MSDFKKDDRDKPKMHLIPTEALLGVADVMSYGARKYEPDNWRKATTWNRYYDAAMRHMLAWQKGWDIDESGLPTIDHAIASLMMLSSLIKTETGEDDRYVGAVIQEETKTYTIGDGIKIPDRCPRCGYRGNFSVVDTGDQDWALLRCPTCHKFVGEYKRS